MAELVMAELVMGLAAHLRRRKQPRARLFS